MIQREDDGMAAGGMLRRVGSRRRTRWMCLPLVALLCVLSAGLLSAQLADSLDELLSALSQRQGFFTSGVLEVRQSDWVLDAESRDGIHVVADLLTRTPMGSERALETSLRIEEEAITRLGPPRQTAWAFYHSPLGSRLVEVPLETGDPPGDPQPSRAAGMKVHGFQDGTVARYDQMAGRLTLGKGSADDAFAFRTKFLDPTLDRFDLLQLLKQGARGVTLSSSGPDAVLVRVRSGVPQEFRFERIEGGELVLAHAITGIPGSPPEAQAFHGNYTRLDANSVASPMSALHVRRMEDGTSFATLHTVRKWERRPLERREIEIRIPRGTQIIRAGDNHNQPTVEVGAPAQPQAPSVETRASER